MPMVGHPCYFFVLLFLLITFVFANVDANQGWSLWAGMCGHVPIAWSSNFLRFCVIRIPGVAWEGQVFP